MLGAIASKMHNQRLLVVVLTWYNNLILLKKGSVKFSILIIEPSRDVVAFLNPFDRPKKILG